MTSMPVNEIYTEENEMKEEEIMSTNYMYDYGSEETQWPEGKFTILF